MQKILTLATVLHLNIEMDAWRIFQVLNNLKYYAHARKTHQRLRRRLQEPDVAHQII